MELELEDGNKISLNPDSKVHIGRNLGFKSDCLSKDRTISRKHLSLHLVDGPIEKYVIKFEVVGKNPIWIHRISDGERRIYRKFKIGELRSGDEFSLSIKKPVLCVVKKKEGEIDEDEVSFEEIGRLGLSEIDPVKEFGFLVKGHEFDNYSKKQLPDVKKWNWFLEETNGGSDDDDDDDDENTLASTSKQKKNKKRNTKKDGLEYDDEWTGDSEEENLVVVKGESSKRPKYTTRSKDSKRPRKNSSVLKNTSKMKNAEVDDDQLEEDDEEDETLGGFIVSEEEVDNEEEDDDESEEEFEDDDEDDD